MSWEVEVNKLLVKCVTAVGVVRDNLCTCPRSVKETAYNQPRSLRLLSPHPTGSEGIKTLVQAGHVSQFFRMLFSLLFVTYKSDVVSLRATLENVFRSFD